MGIAALGRTLGMRRWRAGGEGTAAVMDETRTRLMRRGSRDLKWLSEHNKLGGQWGCCCTDFFLREREREKKTNSQQLANYFGLLYSVPCQWLLSHRGSVAQVAAVCGRVVVPGPLLSRWQWPHSHFEIFISNDSWQWSIALNELWLSSRCKTACLAPCLQPHAYRHYKWAYFLSHASWHAFITLLGFVWAKIMKDGLSQVLGWSPETFFFFLHIMGHTPRSTDLQLLVNHIFWTYNVYSFIFFSQSLKIRVNKKTNLFANKET